MIEQICTSISEFKVLRRSWNELVNSDPQSSVFQAWEWYWAYIVSHLDDQSTLYILKLISNNKLEALLPLQKSCVDKNGVTVIKFLSSPTADQHNLICRESPHKYWQLVLEILDQTFYGCKVLMILDELSEESVYNLKSAFRKNTTSLNWLETTCCSMNPYLNLQSFQMKPRTKTKLNSLSKRDTVEFHVHREAKKILQLQPIFRRFFYERWGHRSDSQIFFTKTDRKFIDALICELASCNQLVLSELSLNGESIAFYLLFLFRNVVGFYRSAFSTFYDKFSPGTILLELTMKHFREEGYEIFDLLRGDYPYKFRYADAVRHNWTVYLATPGLTQSEVIQIQRMNS